MKKRNQDSGRPEKRFNKNTDASSRGDRPERNFEDKPQRFRKVRFKNSDEDSDDRFSRFKSDKDKPRSGSGKPGSEKGDRKERYDDDKFRNRDRGERKTDKWKEKKDRYSEKPKRFGSDKKEDRFRRDNKSGFNKSERFGSRGNQEDKPKKRSDFEGRRGPKPPDYKFLKEGKDEFKKPKKGLGERVKKSDTKSENDDIRLNRYISNSGICSRREADEYIQQGLVTVNGKVVTELGTKVKKSDVVKYNNQTIRPEKPVYVLLNKPKDFITTMEDPEKRKTVMQLVEGACEERIYPVGRLDRNTTGLLLLTNDGELADKLAHPSSNIKKLYQVDLDKPITKIDLEKIASGIELEDGKAEIDDIVVVTPDNKSLGVGIHSGRNRIVRRIFEHLGYEVTKLDRVMYAGLTKKDLPRGRWRYLSEQEVIRLKHFLK